MLAFIATPRSAAGVTGTPRPAAARPLQPDFRLLMAYRIFTICPTSAWR